MGTQLNAGIKCTACPKKMPPVIFDGITSLYLIKGSILLQWVEKQTYYINRSIYLTVRLLEILKVVTPILQPVQITEISINNFVSCRN
jgi:hypothetical protein